MPFCFFLHKLVNNGKNVDSANLCMVFSISLVFCLATIGVGVFRCGNSGCRTFYFFRRLICSVQSVEKKLMMKL